LQLVPCPGGGLGCEARTLLLWFLGHGCPKNGATGCPKLEATQTAERRAPCWKMIIEHTTDLASHNDNRTSPIPSEPLVKAE
jgi:hypothetical protein